MNPTSNGSEHVRSLYYRWEEERLRGWYNRWLRRFPAPLGYLARTAIRVATLGHVYEAQAYLSRGLIDYQQHVESRVSQLELLHNVHESRHSVLEEQTREITRNTEQIDEVARQNATLQHQYGALSQQNEALIQHLNVMKAQIIPDLHGQIATLQKQVTTLQEENTQHVAAIEQQKLTAHEALSRARLLEYRIATEQTQPAEASPESFTQAESMELGRWLDGQYASIRAAGSIEVSLHDTGGEQAIVALANYFGDRMAASGNSYRFPNDVWIDIALDEGPDREALAKNAISRLPNGGQLVTVRRQSDIADVPEFTLVDQETLVLNSGREIVVTLWRHATADS